MQDKFYEYKNGKKILSEWNQIVDDINNDISSEVILERFFKIIRKPSRKRNNDRNSKNMVDSVVDENRWKRDGCDNIKNKAKRNLCLQYIDTNTIEKLEMFLLTCKSQKCVQAITNKIYLYKDRLNKKIAKGITYHG